MTAAKQHTQLVLAARGCLRNGQRAHTCEVEANIAAAVWLAGGRAGWAALDDFVHHTVPPPALLPVCQAPRCIALRPHAHRHAYDSQGQRQPSRRLLAVQNPAFKVCAGRSRVEHAGRASVAEKGTFAHKVQRPGTGASSSSMYCCRAENNSTSAKSHERRVDECKMVVLPLLPPFRAPCTRRLNMPPHTPRGPMPARLRQKATADWLPS